MHKRNAHSFIINTLYQWLHQLSLAIDQSPHFSWSSGSKQRRNNKGRIFCVLGILLPQWGPPAPVPSALLHSLLFVCPPICLVGLFLLTKKKQNKLFFPQTCCSLEVLFIFPVSLTVKLLLKVVFTSLTSLTLCSLLLPLGLCRNCYLESIKNHLIIKAFDLFWAFIPLTCLNMGCSRNPDNLLSMGHFYTFLDIYVLVCS